MDLTVLSGAATIALASTTVFLLVVKCWHLIAGSNNGTRFPKSIMLEAAQRFRDELEKLSREQSFYLVSALVFTVVFLISFLLPPNSQFADMPRWQLIIILALCLIASGYTLYRLFHIVVARRRLAFVRDANMAAGHALQKLTTNQNRTFHDVRCDVGVIDNVIVGLQGIYTVSVISKKPGRSNKVQLKGDVLTFAPGKESLSVARSGRKSKQLARELGRIVGHAVHVRSVIAVPGWEVDAQLSDEYLVVNERNLAMLSGWKDRADFLMNEDVDAIQQELTARCTRFSKN